MVQEADLHPHLRARMVQRGVTEDEIEKALNDGWEAGDSKPGTSGKVLVLPYHNLWEGEFFEEKEVTVYYKRIDDSVMILTVKARYGTGFPRMEGRP